VAATSGSEDDDPLRESKAYNQSIYLMLAVPYLLLGGFGWVVYRGLNKTNRQQPGPEGPAEEPPA